MHCLKKTLCYASFKHRRGVEDDEQREEKDRTLNLMKNEGKLL